MKDLLSLKPSFSTIFFLFIKEFKSSDTTRIVEQGVLFNLTIDESARMLEGQNPALCQQQTKVKEMNFWVVGRQRLSRKSLGSAWTKAGEIYLCFNDSIDQVLLELAFDAGFAKLAI